MDDFVGFNFVLLDASRERSERVTIEEQGPRRERVDLIARQFRDFLRAGDQSDASPHGMMLTHDFKLSRRVGRSSGWLTFLVDRSRDMKEELEEVALVVFARSADEGRDALRRLDPYINLGSLPEPPLVVAVRLVPRVPSVVSEWYGKSAAGFFVEEER